MVAERYIVNVEGAIVKGDQYLMVVRGEEEVAPGGLSTERLAIISHGTVMTLFIARDTGLAPLTFWKSLGLPAFVVLSLPELRVVEVVAEIEPSP